MICTGPSEQNLTYYKPKMREAYAELNRKQQHEPTEMVDEGVDWVDHDGTEWHVYRCPVCYRPQEAT